MVKQELQAIIIINEGLAVCDHRLQALLLIPIQNVSQLKRNQFSLKLVQRSWNKLSFSPRS